MLFAIKLGNKHTWLGMELHMDAHIGTATTLKRVSMQHEEACTIVNNTKMMSGRDVPTMMTSSGKTEMEKIPEEGCHEKVKAETVAEKEDAVLKVLESMSKKIEELDRTAKENPHFNISTKHQRARISNTILGNFDRSTPMVRWSVFDGTTP